MSEWLILGGLGIGAVLVLRPDILQGFFPMTQPITAPLPAVTESEPQAVQQTPGITEIIVTPEILLQARPDILMVIPRCDLDDIIDSDADAFAIIKIWEQGYNQIVT